MPTKNFEKGPWFDKSPTEEELEQILQDHEDWVRRGAKGFPPHRLQGIWLKAVKQADPGARPEYQPAKLYKRDLSYAVLDDAKFDGVELRETLFYNASLERAELRNANYLTAPQIAGSDLEGASLPEGFKWDQATESVRSAAAYARKLYTPILLFSIFMAARAIIPPEGGKVGIQALGLAVPQYWFFSISPWVLLIMQLYYSLYLNKMFYFLGRLPAVFPDGSSIDKYPEPWFATFLARFYSRRILRLTDKKSSLKLSLNYDTRSDFLMEHSSKFQLYLIKVAFSLCLWFFVPFAIFIVIYSAEPIFDSLSKIDLLALASYLLKVCFGISVFFAIDGMINAKKLLNLSYKHEQRFTIIKISGKRIGKLKLPSLNSIIYYFSQSPNYLLHTLILLLIYTLVLYALNFLTSYQKIAPPPPGVIFV